MRSASHREAGFSTIEILIGMMLTAIVIGAAFGGVSQFRGYSAQSEVKDDTLRIARAIEASYAGNGYPTDLASLTAALPRYRVALNPNTRIKWYALSPATDSLPEGYALCLERGPSSNPERYAAYSSIALNGAEGTSSGTGACPATPTFNAGPPSASPSPTATATGLPCPSVTLTGRPATLLYPLRNLAANWPAVAGALSYNIQFTRQGRATTTYNTTTTTYSWQNVAKDTYTVLVTAVNLSGESIGCTAMVHTFTA